MLCEETRHSVTLEVNSQVKYIIINALIQTVAYYFTIFDHEETTASILTLFAYVTSALVFSSFHRMKVARIKLAIEEGEEEWSWAVMAYTIAVATFYGFTQIVDRTLHHSIREQLLYDKCNTTTIGNIYQSYLIEKDFVHAQFPSTVHVLFVIIMFFNFVSFVYTVRFGRKANDIFGDGSF